MEADKINTTELAHKNQEPISYFEKDAGFVFAYKKTEKLASAVYMITNLFSDNEPMKWTLRKKVSDLVSFILEYKDVKDSSVNDFAYNVKSKILELVSMLEISYRAGLISQMNFTIIKQEFNNLSEVFSSHFSAVKQPVHESFSKGFFSVPDNRVAVHEGHQNHVYSTSMSSHDHTHVSHIKDKEPASDKDGFKRSNRQNIILGLLKKKKELTIKDIAQVIKDCSEKTIQRELISFIDAGVLKRTGERRWSKYSLV
ncbi:MAG: hypothetical protein AB201_02835 [Parcubacteria bacterium C7867-006]|nr:MAG: hypothetical protein AB201_02835 [Parcubacteria bacterium C7867-006]